MSIMVPPVVHAGTRSQGEREIFRRLHDDPATKDWIVLHSLDTANHVKNISGEADFVIGSRLVAGGGATDWSGWRKGVSFVARLLARPITGVKDLTSGYFMIKRQVIQEVSLSPIGFKICLEIIAKGNYNRVAEIPITFVGRSEDASKLGLRQIIEYVIQVSSLYGYVFKRKIKGKG